MAKPQFAFTKKRLAAVALGGAAAVSLASLGLLAEAQPPRLLAPPVAADGTLSFADLVERVSPAVVSVLTEREVRTGMAGGLDEFLRFRFGFPDEQRRGDGFEGGVRRLPAQGSGFFIDAAGHIVTNNHVIENAAKIEVRLSDGKTLPARLIGADPLTDLAVLKVDPPKGQTFVQFAEDVRVRVGDWVVAVGNPYGLSGTVTAGIVSAIGGQGRDGQFLDFIQIDAPINRGNSGGPTFDLKGRVIGVNTAIYSESGGSVGIGFAIPARIAKETVGQLIASGAVSRGFLGVSIQDVTTDIAAALGRRDAKGAIIGDVVAGSAAERAGLKPEDVVLAVNNKTIEDARDLTRTVAALGPGAKANMKILRAGAEKTLTVTLDQRPDEQGGRPAAAAQSNDDNLSADLGLRVSELSQAARAQYRIPDGVAGVVVTGVKSDSAAEKAGLQAGVVILQADGKAVNSVAALKKAIEDARRAGKDAVLVRYQAGEAKQFGALVVKK